MDLQNSLMQIGFTEYEAKTYLALLADFPTTGYQISKNSGVPRSMVYEVLSRLKLRGAVLETIEGRASLYRPLPPSVLLEKYDTELQRTMENLRTGLDKLYTAIDDERTWSINGLPSVLAYAAQMIRQVEEEIMLVVNDQALEELRGEIEAAAERGARVRAVLTGEEELGVGDVTRHPPLESELHGLTHTLLVIGDSREVLVAGSEAETTATITTNVNLVLIARQFVWMELFTQRIFSRLGDDLLAQLAPEDREIFNSLTNHI
ncbi:TrmB family transcriptional regulator [Chloroflexota bacterium]